MSDILQQLRDLRPPELGPTLNARVIERAERLLQEPRRRTVSRSVRVFGVFVTATSLAHAVWTVVFVQALAR